MKNIALALFDPQYDHISSRCTKQESAKRHPIFSFILDSATPLVSEIYILADAVDHSAAQRLIPHLRHQMARRYASQISDKGLRASFNQCLKIEILEVNYRNVWSFDSCLSDTLPIVRDLIACLTRSNKRPTNSNATTIIIGLNGGTSQRRASLYISALQQLREKKCNCSVKVYCENYNPSKGGKPKGQSAILDVSQRSHEPVGILVDSFATKDDMLSNDLKRLEKIITVSSKENILLTGPTGAGKTRLADCIMSYLQSIHKEVKGGTGGNCISLNIAALSPSLIESELFGHEKGAFTGAIEQHHGAFERARDGILFLDEIGELPLHLQAKLLTVLDGTPFTRLGGEEPIATTFLLICGTNKDLHGEVKNGRFRADLLERINLWHIDIPALKNRPADIENALIQERSKWREEFHRDVLFLGDAQSAFLTWAKGYSWPGNFREFHRVFRHLAMFAPKGKISLQDVQKTIDNLSTENLESAHTTHPEQDSDASVDAFNAIDLARLAYAITACKKAKTADEAGHMLYKATCIATERKGHIFNGTAYLQRIFKEFHLKASFRNGQFRISTIE